MQISVSPGQLILVARMPMPPSINRANRAQIRERKNYSAADYLAGKKQYYPAVRKDSRAEAYREEALLRLRCPGEAWQSWQDPMTVRAVRENLGVRLELEMWEFFADDRSDTDNRVKELQDILCMHLDIDDHRIARISLHKFVQPRITPYIVVSLRVGASMESSLEKANNLLSQYLEERPVYDETFASSTTLFDRGATAQNGLDERQTIS